MLKFLLAPLLGIALVLGFVAPAEAAVSPIGVAVLAPVQFPPEDFSVALLRLSVFWGKHRNVYGLDVGAIGNITEQNFVGTAVSGVFNVTNGATTVVGLQVAGITNINNGKANVYGIQAAIGANYNKGESRVTGLQVALTNFSDHTVINGFQVGLYNKALQVNGFQIGLVNVTDSLHGLQIGLINFHNKGLFAVSPIINFGF